MLLLSPTTLLSRALLNEDRHGLKRSKGIEADNHSTQWRLSDFSIIHSRLCLAPLLSRVSRRLAVDDPSKQASCSLSCSALDICTGLKSAVVCLCLIPAYDHFHFKAFYLYYISSLFLSTQPISSVDLVLHYKLLSGPCRQGGEGHNRPTGRKDIVTTICTSLAASSSA